MNEPQKPKREVVITGIGLVTPIGIGVDQFWESLHAGRSGVKKCTLFSNVGTPDGIAGEIPEFTEEAARKVYMKDFQHQRKNIKAMCREIQLGVASANLALQHAGVNLSTINHDRLGVEFGANLMLSTPEVLQSSCYGCCESETSGFEFGQWGANGIPRMEPLWLLRYLPNMPACHVSISADARGPSNSLTMDEASANAALAEARRVLLRGHADMIITGATGSTLHPMKTLHLALWQDLATTPSEPQARCRPFERNRSGRVLAEAACSFILEDRAHAEARGAKIWGTLLGTGSSCVVSPSGVAMTRSALANAMRIAIHDANLTPNQIGHINAHGLGTHQCDIDEANAILDVFGPELGRRVPVTAIKSYFGNSGAGCGAVELAASILGLSHGVVPHTLNYDQPDPECPLNIVARQPLPTQNRVVLNVNVTRIGQASAAVVEVI